MTPRVLVAGGGYVGLRTALGLERRRGQGPAAEVVMVNPENAMTVQPLLPEVASASLDARHVMVPLRRSLRRTDVLAASLVGVDTGRRRARLRPLEGDDYEVGYDELVIALGSETKVLPVPGLAEQAIGFGTVQEAEHLADHLLERLEVAEATADPDVRGRALTFVFVGGGYTGVEAMAELEDLAREACREYPRIRPGDLRWVLVEATDRILPTVTDELAAFALEQLRGRGFEVRLETTLESAHGGRVELSSGESLETDTLVWTAGVQPHPLIDELGLPTDDGRLVVDRFLRVEGVDGVWAAGDCAAVPDLVEGGTCPPSAQYAQRQGDRLAANLSAHLAGEPLTPFRHRSKGEMITIGRYQGVGQVGRWQLKGFLPWFARRTYHVWQIPTVERKVRIVAEWTVSLPFRREVVGLGARTRPRAPFRKAADPEAVV